ncbi:hypothetical protein D5086_032150 [Populus alba]|uniref:Uncharacterized protein n=2 Tax=Populus alba TaxID=43335 RepID=A0ACC4AKM8_POPAL|nr:two-component response regulator ARR10-like [Populus alba]TKS10653.1 hypothetical protein D5086_0000079890 [Populus alba]
MAKNNDELSEISMHVDEGRGDMFNPADLRVLAIDANVVCLKYLVAILQKCQYRVTSTTLAAEALKILRENKNDYDVVITDVKRLDMDGFKLLEIIGLEMDLPVILVSAEDSQSNIMKGIRHGARDYLLKPVRIQEMQNIWQHVVRKRLSDSSGKSSSFTKEIIEQESVPSTEPMAEAEVTGVKERDIIGNPNGDACSGKKPRVTWSSELHVKFVDCVEKLEARGERVQPKRIREMMNVEGLSRENIASHLQKYRNLLKKHKDKMSQQDNAGADLNRYGRVSATKNALWNSYGDSTQKSQSVASSFTDSKRMFFQPSKQNVFLDNSLSSNITMRKSVPVPEFKGLNFSSSSSTWKLPTEYTGSQSFGQDPGLCNLSPLLCSPAASFKPSFPMLGHTLIDRSPASVLSNPSYFPGQYGEGISMNLCGSGTSNFREHDSHCAYRDQKSLLEDFMNSEDAKLFLDEEISDMVTQFNSDATPRL